MIKRDRKKYNAYKIVSKKARAAAFAAATDNKGVIDMPAFWEIMQKTAKSVRKKARGKRAKKVIKHIKAAARTARRSTRRSGDRDYPTWG